MWDLTIPERLNCEIDKYAAEVYGDKECGIHDNIAPFFTSQVCSLSLPFQRPTANILDQIVAYANGHRAEKHLSTYWKIPMQWLCNVEWQGLRKAIRREREMKKLHLSKLIHKQLPTFAMLKRNKLSAVEVCPVCMKVPETWDHVLQCQFCEMKQEKMEKMEDVKKILKTKKTHPILQQRLLAAMLQYLNNYKINLPVGDDLFPEVNASFRDQMQLGFGNMFCGVITHKFGLIQQKYYNEIGVNARKFNANEWNIAVIRMLLNFSHDMWKYRCDYVHRASTLSIENQERETAWKICSYVREKPWTMRREDLFLSRKPREYFISSKLHHVRSWVERVQLSMDIAQMVEQTTRQDIRKWIKMPKNPIGKKIKVYAQERMMQKKMRQSKLVFQSARRTVDEAPRDYANVETPILYGGQKNRGKNHIDRMNEECNDELEMSNMVEQEYGTKIFPASVDDGVSSCDSWDNVSEDEKAEYELDMECAEGWNMGLSNFQSDENIKSVQEENEPLKMKPWWKHINNWFVKKLGTRELKMNDEIDKQDEEIVFMEQNESPVKTEIWRNVAIYNVEEESRVQEMESLTMNMTESINCESIGKPSDTTSTCESEARGNSLDFEAYIRMQQKQQAPTRARELLRELLNSQISDKMQVAHNEANDQDSIRRCRALVVARGELLQVGQECWQEEEEASTTFLNKEKRSEKVKAILDDLETLSLQHESTSEENSFPHCSIEEISDVDCLETMDLHDGNVGTIRNSKYEIRKLRSCEKRGKSGITQVLSRIEDKNANKKVFQKSKMIPKEIYVVAGHQREECISKMENDKSWNADKKNNQRKQINDEQQENIKTVREGSDESDKVIQTLSRQFGHVQCDNIERTSNHEHQERANTVRGGSGGEVTKNIQFLSQLKEVDEACPQQRTHEFAAKTRDRDLFRWPKHRKQSLGALPQEHPKQCGQAKHKNQKSNGSNLACEIKYGVENGKKLTEGTIPKMSFRKEGQQAGTHLRISGNMIGKSKFSEVRDSMESNPPKSALTSETLHNDKTGLKNLEVCEQFYSIFRKKNNVES